VESFNTTHITFNDIVVNSDGYGSLLNSHDGEMFETQVNGDWYFVMRAS
jgi:hypothetical protein